MKPLDRKTLNRFVKLAGERLDGDWVILGGTVLPLLGVTHRVTVDIDLAGPEDAGSGQLLILMAIAEEIGLPVEAVNQAGAYFLHRIEGWQDHLLELHHGRRATIHVPDPTLFVLLKLSRLTESDLADCLAMLALARKKRMPVDRGRLRAAVSQTSPEGWTGGRAERRQTLLGALDR